MAEYLEELDNELGQVFAEFATFLYVTLYDSKSNKMLHNIFLESKQELPGARIRYALHYRYLLEWVSH